MLLFQLIVIQVVIFGVVIYFLKRIMLGDTESAVNRLNQSYSEMGKKKEELARKIQQTEEEYQKKKRECERLAAKMKDEAEKEMYEKRDNLLRKAREEAERLIADTVAAKEGIREEIKKEEQLKMTDYCRDILNLTYKDVIRNKIDDFIIENFLEEFAALASHHIPAGTKEAEVITRSSLSDTMKSRIKEAVRKKNKRDLILKETVDEAVLGGIIVKFGSLVLDNSVASKLKESSTVIKKKIEKGL